MGSGVPVAPRLASAPYNETTYLKFGNFEGFCQKNKVEIDTWIFSGWNFYGKDLKKVCFIIFNYHFRMN